MAAIRNFSTNGRKKDKSDMDMEIKLLLHRMKSFLVKLIVVAIVVGAIVAFAVYESNVTYSRISVVKNYERINLDTTSYIDNHGSLIAYSMDGMSCISSKGESIWSMTYDMQDPIVRRSDTYVGVCDYNGHIIMIADMQGNISNIDTKLPIRDFVLCKEGRVGVIIDDGTNSWVNLYDVKGTKYSEIKATMSQTGYPMSIDVSDEVLAVSYMYVNSEALESRVAFYNFGGVGENVPDKIVSNYGYSEVIVPTIEYLDKESIYAVADDRILFYSGEKQPKSIKDNLISEKVVGVYTGGSSVGLVFYDASGEKKYKIDVYNKSGDVVYTYRFNMDYKDIVVRDDQILIYNEAECIIVNNDGKEKFQGSFEEPVKFIGTTDSAKKFLFITENALEVVRFE